MNYKLTAVITKEEDIFVAFCPELDIASQGYTIEEAKKNLKEAISLFFEHASLEEIRERLKEDIYITPVEVAVA
jgi:predicted RNase H-like HicB family nuclease